MSMLAQSVPLLATALGLTALGVAERAVHRRALHGMPLRVHVNGTRGKSSTTRLIAAALRAAGRRTVGKTTGSLPRVLLPNGDELAIVRRGRANVIEQRDVVALAQKLSAEALVLECMALRPRLQWLCEHQLVDATHAVITNVRPDHLEVMGPSELDVARALCGMVPRGGTLYTCEGRHLDVLAYAARDRGSALVAVGDEARLLPDGVRRCHQPWPTGAEMARFGYREHAANVAVALSLLHDVGVAREVALDGMWAATPDVGALATSWVDFFGRTLAFVNGFAANDPVSTEGLWREVVAQYVDGAASTSAPGFAAVPTTIAVVNCRDDRPERSRDLGAAAAGWPRPNKVVLMGRGTHVFAQAWRRAGGPAELVRVLGDVPAAEVFECLLEHAGAAAVVVGMGNIGGEGLPLLRHFHNRRRL